MSINTELQLFRCLKDTYLQTMIERSAYNKRRRKLFGLYRNDKKTLKRNVL